MDKLASYAKLLVHTGIGIQKGQKLFINAPIEAAALVRLCANEAYTAGCGEVIVDWTDNMLQRSWYLYADDSVFDSFPAWHAEMLHQAMRDGAAFLSITDSDPDALFSLDSRKIMRAAIARSNATEDVFLYRIKNHTQWCIATVPGVKWARRIYPNLPEQEAYNNLVASFYQALRIRESSNAVEVWKMHGERLKHRQKVLTDFSFRSLHLTTGLGTDLTLELPQNHCWESAFTCSTDGVYFCCNIPTEEVFTSPLKFGANGTMVSSHPIAMHGSTIDRIEAVFENGRAVSVNGSQPVIDVFRNVLAVDEGLSYLGEVAFVPGNSPLSKLGTTFHNQIFDENIACHLSFGQANPSIKDAIHMTDEELAGFGLNEASQSITIPIGTPDLHAVGITADGTEVVIMNNGEFEF